ncbi:PPC domain-containing DNA-binding protein [Variovorax boronicumulans]|uniref:PPC domain-containing DNA-binding protein n=1 Tax=Variovorax boronicumulans TaxID=436515 RepID=UPI003398671E
MEAHALRLNPGDDLRAALDALLAQRGAEAAFVVSGIGSLSGARIRYAGAETATTLEGDLEILTLSGTLSPDGAHLHISVSDSAGQVRGGHVAPGCIVRTTAEILIAWLPEWRFARAHDPATGFPELVPRPKP